MKPVLVTPTPSDRALTMRQLAQTAQFDLAVIGGGATGLGVALDAATRGFKVVLIESHDFAKGTSSRATKLLHGGVRYLAQGNISLVREALHERTNVLNNAPHLAQPLPFVMPCYKHWEAPFYGVGLKLYDTLAGKAGLGPTRFLDPKATQSALPNVNREGLKGGVEFWDGQFDDARLALAIARTAAAKGAVLLNYCKVTKLAYKDDRVSGVHCEDGETGKRFTIHADCVVNAAGVWVDQLRQDDAKSLGAPVKPMVAPSQGVHLVVDRSFLPGDHALLVPKTSDGRVLFAVPWLGKVILGTTDTPRKDLPREPKAFDDEVQFILRESARYLAKAPTRKDVRSIWVGLRPLVRPQSDSAGKGDATRKISREHTVLVSKSGLVTVTGGKWTTYRAMAEDVLEQCFDNHLLLRASHGQTEHLRLIGAPQGKAGAGASAAVPITAAQGPHLYGTERAVLAGMPGHEQMLAPGLSEAMVRFAARFEYARTTEDVLARRNRLLFLDAASAIKLAPRVASILQSETGVDPQLDAFLELAQGYLLPASVSDQLVAIDTVVA